jgi:hypothetical protein
LTFYSQKDVPGVVDHPSESRGSGVNRQRKRNASGRTRLRLPKG